MVLLEDQGRTLWDRGLVALGFHHLDRSARGDEISAYHLQAAIAAVHARAPDAAETDWLEILDLYDQLLRLQPSPVVELNRAVAVARARRAGRCYREALELPCAAPERRFLQRKLRECEVGRSRGG